MATTRTQAQIQADINYNNETIPGCSISTGNTAPANYSIFLPANHWQNNVGALGSIAFKNCYVECKYCGNRALLGNGGYIISNIKLASNPPTSYNNHYFHCVNNLYYAGNLTTMNPTATYYVSISASISEIRNKMLHMNHRAAYTRNPSLVNKYRTELNEAIARDNAVSSFDSLYNTASNASNSSTLSSHISTLNGYLSSIGTNAGTSSSYYTSRSSRMSTLNSKLTTLRNQENAEAQRNTNANNAASSFDNLHNSISGDISTVTSDNLSSLQSYLNTVSSNSSTSDSRYTTRKTKYDTLKREYDVYQIRLSNLSQVGTNIAGINTAITNTKNTVLPEIVTGYSNTYNTGRDVYQIVVEKINDLKQ